MKKHLLFLLLTLLPLEVCADNLINGIWYSLNSSDLTATVVSHSGQKYSGNVVIPSTVTFSNKTYTVTTIWNEAFYQCKSLTSISIPNSVTEIRQSAFEDCDGLTSITIPGSVTTIGSRAFTSCNYVTSITLSEGLEAIGSWAFASASSITSIIIPNGVKSIGENAFYSCINLTSITIPESVTYIGTEAFENCQKLISATIPNGVTSIPYRTFDSCYNLTSVTIPNSVTNIGQEAFSDCTSLTSITIPSSVTTIGSSAFSGCDALTSVEIPNSVTSIGNYAFDSCNNLIYVTMNKETPPSIQSSVFSNRTNATLYVPSNSVYTYKYADYWKEFKSILPIGSLRDINSSNISIDFVASSLIYNGSAQTPEIIIKDGNVTLTNGIDYSLSYSNTTIGYGTITITGMGQYTGTRNVNFYISPKPMYYYTITVSDIAAVTYNGSAQTPAVTVNDTKLNTSYYTSGITKVFSNDNNININIKYLAYEQNTCSDIMCCIVVQSPSGEEMILDSRDLFNHNKLGAYCVSQDGYTFIDLQSKEAGTWHLLLVQGYAGNWYYSLSNTMPTTNSYTLQSGTDYTVSYSNNTNAGTATVTITGKGNYTGTKNANFTINPKNASNLTINSIAAQTYSGSAKTPTVTVRDGSTTLTNGTHYTVAYSNNTNAGTATVTITGMGNYTGTKNANFTINKAALTITANSYTIDKDDALPAFAVSYSGFQNGETSSVLTTQPTITCDATDSETPGVYDITPSGAAATNYSFNYVKGTLTINANVTIAMRTGSGDARNLIAYSSKYGLDFSSRPEIKAYIACGYNWKKEVMLVHVNVVPPYTGMVIRTSNSIYDGGEYEVPITTEDYYYSNLLVPVVETQTVTPTETIYNVDYTNFSIGTLNGGDIGFVKIPSNWTTHNKSYLRVPTSLYNNTPSARELGGFGIEFVEGDEATAIQNIKNDALENDGDYYDLQGRKVKPLSKGIYIHNGKKVFVK